MTVPSCYMVHGHSYLLTPWSIVLLEKLTGSAASQEIPRILWNPEVHYSTQVPATSPYPEPTPSSPHNPLPVPDCKTHYVNTCLVGKHIRTHIRANMQTCIHYIHTHIHTYIHTCIHTHIRTYVHTYLHTYIHTYIQTWTGGRQDGGDSGGRDRERSKLGG